MGNGTATATGGREGDRSGVFIPSKGLVDPGAVAYLSGLGAAFLLCGRGVVQPGNVI